MKIESKPKQYPILITLAYYNINDIIIKKSFIINYQNFKENDYASTNMWKSFFNYLLNNINQNETIIKNLGAFYGFYYNF